MGMALGRENGDYFGVSYSLWAAMLETIKRGQSVVEQADSGRSFVDDAPRELIERALNSQFPATDFFLPAKASLGG